MLVTLNEVLPGAREGRYAVPAFDTREDVIVRAILETAEAERSPVIMMTLEYDVQGNGLVYLPGLIRAVADHHDIPVVLHLDHCWHEELVYACIDRGYSSVMFDGSKLSFDENARITGRIVKRAHPKGITVEAELGFVGGATLDGKERAESVLTDPRDVRKFVELTEVDALAVSIGTAHGVYKSEPKLNIERLKEINEISPVPLVLHGGSGTPDDQVRDAIRNGISKLNLYADVRIAMGRGFQEAAGKIDRPDPLPDVLFQPIKDAISQVVRQKIHLTGSNGRAPGGGPADETPPTRAAGRVG